LDAGQVCEDRALHSWRSGRMASAQPHFRRAVIQQAARRWRPGHSPMHHRLDGMSMQRRPWDEPPVMPPIACAATRICSDPLACYSGLINSRPCQLTHGSCLYCGNSHLCRSEPSLARSLSARTWRVEWRCPPGDASAGALDSGAVHAVADVSEFRHRVLMRRPASPFVISNDRYVAGAGTRPRVGQLPIRER
jgi:hypothetical protein